MLSATALLEDVLPLGAATMPLVVVRRVSVLIVLLRTVCGPRSGCVGRLSGTVRASGELARLGEAGRMVSPGRAVGTKAPKRKSRQERITRRRGMEGWG